MLCSSRTRGVPVASLAARNLLCQNSETESLFTGLIEERGIVQAINQNGKGCDLEILAMKVIEDVSIGDSIAVNGCCLTVVKFDSTTMTFQAGEETLSRTNLGTLKIGNSVNLERSLKAGDRLGGHYVTGHVDALGTFCARNDDGEWAVFWFSVPEKLTRQMASKGSVTVDGISLTLVQVEKDRFSVALIPHTLAMTTLGDRHVGDQVNIETDLLAKYVEQQLTRGLSTSPQKSI